MRSWRSALARLVSLYVTAGLCFAVGRIDDAVRYSDAAQTTIRAGRHYLPYGIQGNMGGAYLAMGQPERWVTAVTIPELNSVISHFREVLGDETYESLARKGKAMTTAATVAYAFDQIDQARAELDQLR